MEEIYILTSDVGGKPGVIANIDRKIMTKVFKNQLSLMLRKYENLGLNESATYKFLKEKTNDNTWTLNIGTTLSKIKNAEKMFNISKQINSTKNDQRVDEVFAEFDTADRIVNKKFFGNFDKVEYLSPLKNKRQPDFLTERNTIVTPVEVKLLSPQDLKEDKFFAKLIDKINDHALPQLKSYYSEKPFKNGMIFIWSHQPVELANLQYDDLESWFEKKVVKQDFEVTIICILYKLGMWEFYIKKN